VQATFDVDGLLHAILTCVTAGPGLGFNRAVLFLPTTHGNELTAAMAIGPATPEEAQTTWARLASEQQTLGELLQRPAAPDGKSGLSALVEGLSIPLVPSTRHAAEPAVPPGAPLGTNPLVEAYYTRQVRKIVDAHTLDGLPPRLREAFGGTEIVCVPLLAKERAIGLIIADNAFNREPISDERIQLLELLAQLAGLALDNARIYQQVESQAQALQTALDELKTTHDRLLHSERLATVGAVVARVSHEIRNPLTTIGGFARTLGSHPDDIARVARGAGIIVEEVEKLEVLLKEMLDFTSPRPPTFESTDVNHVITTLADVHSDELAAHGVALSLATAPGLPTIPADPNQLHRAFLNLWRNAVQAMEPLAEGRQRVLTIRTAQAGDTVRISFGDSGPGISPDRQPQIFTPFFTTKPRGTGLGLAVVRKIIDDHHGSIEVQSSEHAGATLTVVLPVRRPPS
jgi:signal transduction histidine kinase